MYKAIDRFMRTTKGIYDRKALKGRMRVLNGYAIIFPKQKDGTPSIEKVTALAPSFGDLLCVGDYVEYKGVDVVNGRYVTRNYALVVVSAVDPSKNKIELSGAIVGSIDNVQSVYIKDEHKSYIRVW